MEEISGVLMIHQNEANRGYVNFDVYVLGRHFQILQLFFVKSDDKSSVRMLQH